MVMPYHLHMPSYFLETFTEYPCEKGMGIFTTHSFLFIIIALEMFLVCS